MTIANIIALILGSLGLLFMIVSFIGVITFPDFYTRLHAQGVGDTVGVLLLLVAMMFCFGLKIISAKLLLIFVITLFTNPLGTSILMQAVVYVRGEDATMITSDDSEPSEDK